MHTLIAPVLIIHKVIVCQSSLPFSVMQIFKSPFCHAYLHSSKEGRTGVFTKTWLMYYSNSPSLVLCMCVCIFVYLWYFLAFVVFGNGSDTLSTINSCFDITISLSTHIVCACVCFIDSSAWMFYRKQTGQKQTQKKVCVCGWVAIFFRSTIQPLT